MSDFTTFLVKDERLNCKSNLGYAVYKGSQQNTQVKIRSTSCSSSQIVFNVIVPSQQTLLDRKIGWEATIRFSFTIQYKAGAVVPAPLEVAIKWGKNVTIQPFPLNNLCQTLALTINSNTVTQNQSEVLPMLLKFFTREELNYFQQTSPCMPDNFQSYSTNKEKAAFVGAGIENMSIDGMIPRGAFKLEYLNSVGHDASGNDKWKVDPLAASPATQTIYGAIKVTENVMISPLLFAHYAKQKQGIFGIANMQLVANMGLPTNLLGFTDFDRFGTLNANSNIQFSNVTVDYGEASNLHLTYLTPMASDALENRNIVPYSVYNRFNYTNTASVPAATVATSGANTTLVTPSSNMITSNVINLNQVPDSFVICVRPTTQLYNRHLGGKLGQFFMPIKKISMNFNNQSGILASANDYQLWRMSADNGVRQSWGEWSGFQMQSDGGTVDYGNTAVKGAVMVGSVLCLKCGRDIALVSEYLAPGAIGQYQFQIELEYYNYSDIEFNTGDLQLVIIPVQSGMFVLERGSSSVFTALLSKEMIMDASQKQAIYSESTNRMVGGSFFDDIKTAIGDVASVVKPVADIVGPAMSVAKFMGAGVSGGAEDADRMYRDGGKKKGKLARHM